METKTDNQVHNKKQCQTKSDERIRLNENERSLHKTVESRSAKNKITGLDVFSVSHQESPKASQK